MRYPLGLCLAGLVGCAASTEVVPPINEAALDVQVLADAARYRPLDAVVVRVHNRSDETVYENRCDGSLEGFGFIPGQWNGSYGSARVCLFDAGQAPTGPGFLAIAPGASVVDTFFVNSQAYAGQWRVRLDLRDADNDPLPLARRVSAAFTVEP